MHVDFLTEDQRYQYGQFTYEPDEFELAMRAVSFMRGLKNAPGYRNFYELRLRRLLSKDLPNIANANGFALTEYKIEYPLTP